MACDGGARPELADVHAVDAEVKVADVGSAALGVVATGRDIEGAVIAVLLGWTPGA